MQGCANARARSIACLAPANPTRVNRPGGPMLYHALPGPGRSACGRCARSASMGAAALQAPARAAALARGARRRAAQARRRLRGVRAGGSSRTRVRRSASTRSTSGEPTSPSSEEVALRTPFATLLHFRKRRARPQPPRADRRTDVGPLRHAAARHGAHDARRPRRLHHRLAQRPRRAAQRRPLRPRRVHRARDRVPARRSARART